jgi:pimeloyl-ACP methyl ester carboxylesterase
VGALVASMQPTPELRYDYVRVLGENTAYFVAGHGPVDVLTHTPPKIQLDADTVHFIDRLTDRGRCICVEIPSTDTLTALVSPTGEPLFFADADGTTHARDPFLYGELLVGMGMQMLLDVLDAAGSARAVVIGDIDLSPDATALAASHPDRVQALVLIDPFARFIRASDHPWGLPMDVLHAIRRDAPAAWGTGVMARLFSGAPIDPTVLRAYCAAAERFNGGPEVASLFIDRYVACDTRALLPRIEVPTLVVHRSETFIAAEYCRYVADNIPGAEYVEVESVGLPPRDGFRPILAAIEPFLAKVAGT